ncbi:MAG: sortase domain-bontaining protein [Acidimicrobiales bacterium]
MTFARVLGGIGRTLITAGIVLFAFVAYQLWGTGYQEQRSQDELEKQFAALEAEIAAQFGDELPVSEVAVTTTTLPLDAVPDEPAESLIPELPSGKELDIYAPREGEPLAVIDIPRIGTHKVVVEGVSVDDLKRGPGHYLESPMPGNIGNASIAGHRTTYGAPFGRIAELRPGDTVSVSTLWGDFTYEIMTAGEATANNSANYVPGDPNAATWIVNPAETWVLENFGDNRLTLTACHPRYSARQRIIVAGRLVDTPAPPPRVRPVDDPGPIGGESILAAEDLDGAEPATEVDVVTSDLDLDAGLAGDQSALAPAIWWGLATLAVWLVLWLVARTHPWAILLGIALPFLASSFYPDAIADMWLWASLAAAVWMGLWLVSRAKIRWQPFLLIAPLGLLALIPCFYYVDRFLPAG